MTSFQKYNFQGTISITRIASSEKNGRTGFSQSAKHGAKAYHQQVIPKAKESEGKGKTD
jgi:hypothetical protein